MQVLALVQADISIMRAVALLLISNSKEQCRDGGTRVRVLPGLTDGLISSLGQKYSTSGLLLLRGHNF